MLAKTRRLNRVNFLHVLNSSPKALKTADFQIRYVANGGKFNRYSVVIPKKVLKLAVDRNALKRRIYDLVGDIPGNHDIIIYPRNEKISSELHSLVSKIS